MEEQLKRTAAAHSEHLEQVIRTQRQLFEIEHNQKLEEVSCFCVVFSTYCISLPFRKGSLAFRTDCFVTLGCQIRARSS